MNIEHKHDLERIETEAAQWVARLNSGEISDAERRQFSRWIKQSDTHRQTFFELRAIMADVGNAVEKQSLKARKRHTRLSRLAMAACLLLAVATAFVHYDLQNYWLADHITTAGEQQTLTLADGSTVYLNTASAVKVEFDQSLRRIELLQGEAEFVVAHDSNRPFTVVADGDSVTALGTDFSVFRNDGDLTVTVFENAVQVKRRQEPVAVVEQGRQMYLPEHSQQAEIMEAGIEEARAWRNGKLVFTARPLREVIAEINRYRHGEVLLLAQEAAEHPVSGVFAIRQLDQSIEIIADTLSLNSMQIDGVLTVLY